MPDSVFSDKTIMVIGTDPWNSPLLSKHRLVLELCQRNRVLYVEPFYHLGNLLRRRPQSTGGAAPAEYHHEAPRSLTLVQPYRLPKSAYVAALRSISERAFSAQLRLRRFDPDVILCFSPYFAFMAGHQSLFIYYPVDSYGHVGASADAIERENATLARADLVACGTQTLYRRFEGKARRLEFLPHGVAVEAVARSAGETPADMAALPRPVVGFLGAVNFHLDVALLEALALSRPDWSLPLVGPLSRDDFGGGLPAEDLNRLRRLPNVHLLGPRPSEQVGAYLAAFDVCIMPYDTSDPTVHFATHKPLQCLAVGTPVVTTCEASDDLLPPNTFVAANGADFAGVIERVLAADSPERRAGYRRAASDYTWSKRLEQLSDWIIGYGLDQRLKQRRPGGSAHART
jgi:glycosyltransferase involved in cell wall biosynthesis